MKPRDIITKERYKMLKFAFEKGANLAPIDFTNVQDYETFHNIEEKLIINSPAEPVVKSDNSGQVPKPE